MTRSLFALALLFAAPILAEEKTGIRLPAAPEAVVISLEIHRGLAPPGRAKQLMVAIHADGTIRALDIEVDLGRPVPGPTHSGCGVQYAVTHRGWGI